MSTHKHIDIICLVGALLSLILCAVVMNAEALGIRAASGAMGYESRLFDTGKVHTIDIVIDDWEGFLETARSEEYSVCSVVIDGETISNVGIRGKGNTSLSSVASMDSDRYSFKIEFDQYDSTKTYHGLDKLSLNNIIQDNTYMKDYLSYQMMGEFGVPAPLCSYAFITVNGEDWGLYLAVEAVEEAFLQRNYGRNYGDLYKPDSMDMGGGRGNGKDFEMTDVMDGQEEGMPFVMGSGNMQMPDRNGGGGGGMGSSGTKLQYIDDDPNSYSTIFSSAKTDVTKTDQNRLISSLKQLSAYENPENVVNIDDVLRYFVVHNYVVNGDSYTGNMIHNYYLYEEDGRLSMIPWDYNLAFGTFQSNNASSAVNDDIDTILSDRPMQAWIFSDETYSSQYYALYTELMEQVDVQTIIDDAYQLIAPYVEMDPTAFCTYDEFQTGVKALKEFCTLRSESVRRQLAGSAEVVAVGTLDLSDMGTMNRGGGHGNMGGMDFGNRGASDSTAAASEPGGTPQPENQSTEFPGDTQGTESAGKPDRTQPGVMVIPEGMQRPGRQTDQASGNQNPSENISAAKSFPTPGQGGGEFQRFDRMNANVSAASSQPAIILLAASAIVLLAGLVIAKKYRH